MALKIDAELEGQLIYAFKNNMKNFAIFWQAFFQIDLDEKVKKNYASWHWRVMQSLKKNWLFVPKMTWGIWWILMQAVESMKVCTLYFCRKYVMFEPKKYRGAVSWKNDLWFLKWYKEFADF